MTQEYKQSLTEVNTILDFMEEEYINKLPNKLINFIKDNMDTSYSTDISINIPINEQNIKKDTKILLSLIYRNYWCSPEEKEELIERDFYIKRKNEKEMCKKYNLNDIFKNNKKININEKSKNDIMAVTEYKESLLKKIINKIKVLFKHIKN